MEVSAPREVVEEEDAARLNVQCLVLLCLGIIDIFVDVQMIGLRHCDDVCISFKR